jgi:uncharacterized protein YbaR (Trm112 family)
VAIRKKSALEGASSGNQLADRPSNQAGDSTVTSRAKEHELALAALDDAGSDGDGAEADTSCASASESQAPVDVPLLEEPAIRQPAGSQLPASRAQKIVFRCPHCKSPLSVRPVKSTSRLVCPACNNAVYVTISGQIHKRLPSRAVREGKRAAAGKESTESSTERVMSASLVDSNPLDEEAKDEAAVFAQAPTKERRAETPAPKQVARPAAKPAAKPTVKQKVAAFREHARSADPRKTLFITEEKSSAVEEVAFDSEEVREAQLGRRDGGACRWRATAVGVAERCHGGRSTHDDVDDDLATATRSVAHTEDESLVRKALIASKRRSRTRPRRHLGALLAVGLVLTVSFAAPFLALGGISALERARPGGEAARPSITHEVAAAVGRGMAVLQTKLRKLSGIEE